MLNYSFEEKAMIVLLSILLILAICSLFVEPVYAFSQKVRLHSINKLKSKYPKFFEILEQIKQKETELFVFNNKKVFPIQDKIQELREKLPYSTPKEKSELYKEIDHKQEQLDILKASRLKIKDEFNNLVLQLQTELNEIDKISSKDKNKIDKYFKITLNYSLDK